MASNPPPTPYSNRGMFGGSSGFDFSSTPAPSTPYGGSFGGARAKSLFSTPASAPVSSMMISRVQKSFDTGKYSDLTVICGGRRWKVHKLQLSQNSEVFEAMLQGHFKEAQQREISLPDDDEGAVNHLLRYMYHLQYLPSSTEPNHFILHMRVAKAADKYRMPELCSLAESSFRIAIITGVHLSSFADAVLEAYSNDGYDVFRSILARETFCHLESMRKDKTKYKYLWDAVDTVPRFSGDVLRLPPIDSSNVSQDASNNTSANKARGDATPFFGASNGRAS